MIGKKFGRLTVIAMTAGRKDSMGYFYSCRCDCGNVIEASGTNVRRGHTTSCGCVQRKRAAESQLTHGNARRGKLTTEYNIWRGMLSRCTNPAEKAYRHYGGRGIKVCERWLDGFENFLDDMGKRPPGTSIDRIDNNGDYKPDNWKWSTRSEQANNKRNSIRITRDGETKNLKEWTVFYSIDYDTVYKKIYNGMAPNIALDAVIKTQGVACA